jgi:ATP-binding cassette subfamily F protein uup
MKASKPAEKAAPAVEAPVKKKPSGKMTYAERNELKKLDKEMPELEKKKEEIAAEMVAKSADHHAIMQLSLELEKTTGQLESMGERWLVLMEKQEAEA